MNVFRELWLFVRGMLYGIVRNNPSYVARRLRGMGLATPALIDTNVFVTQPENFGAGEHSALYHGCYILNDEGTVTIGNNSHLGAYCYVNAARGTVRIGNDVAIGPGTKIIAYSNHYETGKKVSEVRMTEDITIGDNVFIGANCSLLPGTTIHANVVIAAGAVVKGELTGNAIYGGIPCRKIQDGWYE
jgi:galactoside O-acetyltransferase